MQTQRDRGRKKGRKSVKVLWAGSRLRKLFVENTNHFVWKKEKLSQRVGTNMQEELENHAKPFPESTRRSPSRNMPCTLHLEQGRLGRYSLRGLQHCYGLVTETGQLLSPSGVGVILFNIWHFIFPSMEKGN